MRDNKLELVVEVESTGERFDKSINTGLSGMEDAARRAATGGSHGIDGLTVSMVKGATSGNLLADAIKTALHWVKEFTIDAVKDAPMLRGWRRRLLRRRRPAASLRRP